jgi:hypothetical protein
MDGVDRRLELVRPRPVEPQAAADDVLALVDERAIPFVTVLIREQHELAILRAVPELEAGPRRAYESVDDLWRELDRAVEGRPEATAAAADNLPQ